MQDLPHSLQEKILQSIDQVLSKKKDPLFAAFDADGTLWDTDIGEAFFHYQINQKLLSSLPSHPWNHYHQLKIDQSPPAAYLWLAQINKGHSLREVKSWTRQCIDSLSPFPLLNGQKRIISYLQSKKVKIFVVTASIKWSVEPAAELYGIPSEQVLGVKTKIDSQGRVTDVQDGPITWKKGKVDALLEATQGVKPFFCAGNTLGDFDLLESSTDLRLAMALSPPQSRLFQDESLLADEAQKRGWFCYRPWNKKDTIP